jgi:hypothetical protein
MDEGKTTDPTPASETTPSYEAPRVEAVLTGDDVDRECQGAVITAM